MTQTPNTGEAELIRRRYEKRKLTRNDLYSRLNPVALDEYLGRSRELSRLIRSMGIEDLAELDIFELGCGGGGNLLEFLQMGANPDRISACDLLPDRVAAAKGKLPGSIRILSGDAIELPIPKESFDLIYQATVFSSILDSEVRSQLANVIWAWLKPGGAILWYDLAISNPRNPDVTGLPQREIRRLFPEGDLKFRRITLAPPIARKLESIGGRPLRNLANSIPVLRSHWIGRITKPN